MRQLLSVTTEESLGTRIVHRGLKLCLESEISSDSGRRGVRALAGGAAREKGRGRERDGDAAVKGKKGGRKDPVRGRIVNSLCKPC